MNSRKCSKKFIYFLFNSLATRFSLQTWWLFQCHLIPAVVDWIQNLHLVRHRMKNTQKSQQFFNVKLFDFILICLFGWNRCCGGCACSSISSAARIFIISAKLTDCCRKSVWHPPDTCELMTQKSENLFTLSAYWGYRLTPTRSMYFIKISHTFLKCHSRRCVVDCKYAKNSSNSNYVTSFRNLNSLDLKLKWFLVIKTSSIIASRMHCLKKFPVNA